MSKNLISISDTHTQHEKIQKNLLDLYDLYPDSILIHSGDISYRGKLSEIKPFLIWFSSLPFSHKILIAGNHDFLFEDNSALVKQILKDEFPGISYLENSGIEINEIKFWGSPVTPRFYDWAFNKDEDIDEYWGLIPDDVNVLITHGPPYKILDQTERGLNVGCKFLANRIAKLPNLKVHVFGHIHEANGTYEKDGVVFVNASILDEDYEVKNSPILIKL
jgi:Icc-related predicted phosphoesterase